LDAGSYVTLDDWGSVGDSDAADYNSLTVGRFLAIGASYLPLIA